ncbi:hypothetical protein [Campylobacter sp.]|uniref:hypothetical protein n=1 Tax=Campylobacter sp. TaxID=205 RepID=UPI002AA67C5D|nr:hypothetical protein [Campylobacter sp.]MCI7447625.1 hypothetical protein [Campylobacter sp.]
MAFIGWLSFFASHPLGGAFILKALRSPALLQKLFRRFFATQPVGSADFVLENSAQNFCSCHRRRSRTASAAALKLKIALKSWSLVFYSRYRKPKGSTNLEFLRINLEFLEIASLRSQ